MNVDNDTLRRILDNPEAMAAVERIEGWRSLGDNIIETIINKSEKVKELKEQSQGARADVPSRGVDDWRRLLADPSTQWETGFSARASFHPTQARHEYGHRMCRHLWWFLQTHELLSHIAGRPPMGFQRDR